LLLIETVDSADDLFEGAGLRAPVGVGIEELLLGAADGGEDHPRLVLLVADVQLRQAFLRQRHLVAIIEDDEVGIEAEGGAVVPKDARAGRVERADPAIERMRADETPN